MAIWGDRLKTRDFCHCMEYDEIQRAKGLQGAGERGACSHMGVYTQLLRGNDT